MMPRPDEPSAAAAAVLVTGTRVVVSRVYPE
jgi:hypothetical protein